MQVVQFASHFAVVEFVDGLRFRLFAVCNHDIREYEIVSKFTITRAVSAMVSKHIRLPPLTCNGVMRVRADTE
jgi:hypothetical protein